MYNFSSAGIMGWIMNLLFMLPGIFIGFSFHEFAHAYVAYLLGDNTAKYQGRLTLDPMAHFDALGFIALLVFRFGWAKPVPVNPLAFKDRKKGMILVSVAGPIMNFIIATITLIVINIVYRVFRFDNIVLSGILNGIYIINIGLGVFNLLPVPPLDGSKILAGFLPPKYEYAYLYRMQQYSYLILIVLLYTGIASLFLSPLYALVHSGISTFVGFFF